MTNFIIFQTHQAMLQAPAFHYLAARSDERPEEEYHGQQSLKDEDMPANF